MPPDADNIGGLVTTRRFVMTELSIPQVTQKSTTQNPRTLVNPGAIPHELRPYKQFVCWKYVDRGKPKPDKIPVNARTLGNAGATWPNTWTSQDTAIKTYQANYCLSGIGYVLTANDPYVMIDIDNCILYGEPNEFACAVLNYLGTYAERSPSGRGLRLFVHSRHQPDAIKRPEIEIYSTGRFATLTGDVLDDRPIAKVDDLDCFINKFVPKSEQEQRPTTFFSGNDRLLPSGDDAALWDYIFRVNPLAEPIYNGDLSNVRTRKDGTPDDSHAVILLLNSLAYWTKGDAGRMDRMIRQTYLDKSKWNENRRGWTWLYGRIQDAINFTQRGR